MVVLNEVVVFIKVVVLNEVVVLVMSGELREGATVLNIFNDLDYNRSVITIVAGIDSVSKSSLLRQ